MISRFIIAGLLAFILINSPALAYGTDVHFNLTYALSRLAGFPQNDARWIAAADESMDHQDSTTAFDGALNTAGQVANGNPFWISNGSAFHAFMLTESPASILRREQELENQTIASASRARVNRDSMIRTDIALGQFVHYEQDVFAHRRHDANELDPLRWHPYGPVAGHARDGHQPDYVAWRIPLAELMIRDCYGKISNIARRVGYVPQLISPQRLNDIVIRLAAAYPRVRTHDSHGNSTGEAIEDLSSQSTAASVIRTAAGIPEAVPLFGLAFTLPYDHPDTTLDSVKAQMGEPVSHP